MARDLPKALVFLGLGLGILATMLQGCGGGGDAPTPAPTQPPHPPTPAPPPPPAPIPTPAPGDETIKWDNEYLALGAGITLSGDSKGTIQYDLQTDLMNASALWSVYSKYRSAFSNDAVALIDSSFNASSKLLTGMAMSLMMTHLSSDINVRSPFLNALQSTSTQKVEFEGTATVKSQSPIPMTYFPCAKVFKISYVQNHIIVKTLTGMNDPSLWTCWNSGSIVMSRVNLPTQHGIVNGSESNLLQVDGLHEDEQTSISSSMIV